MMLHFKKMFADDCDIVIFDGRENKLQLTPEQISYISDRKRGVGCDQIGILRHSEHWQEMTFLEMYNHDAAPLKFSSGMARCVADMLMMEEMTDSVIIETLNGSLNCWKNDDNIILEKPSDDGAPVHVAGSVAYVFDGKISVDNLS